jgi:hypothetical protein
MTLPTKGDWRKVPAILRGEHPRPFLPRLVVGEVDWTHVVRWFEQAHEYAPWIAWDTEYLFDEENPHNPDNYSLTMVSIGWPGMSEGVQLIWMGGGCATSQEKSEFVRLFWRLCQAKTHVFHNAKAELRSTHKTWGWNWRAFIGRFHDTMLAHAVYWSEWPHSLEFLESVYSPYPKVKHLPTTDPLRNWGDTLVTMAAFERLQKEWEADPASKAVYETQSLKLVAPCLQREIEGIQVNHHAVKPAIQAYKAKMEEAVRLAWAYCGWPINLKSPTQLKFWLYTVEALASKTNKKTKKTTVNEDAVALLRGSILPFDHEMEAKEGVTLEYVRQRVEEGANPLLEALVLFGHAKQVMSHYLEPLVEAA